MSSFMLCVCQAFAVGKADEIKAAIRKVCTL